MEQNIKLLPQGINDFGRIRRENYYYVDKTMYLEKIEKDSSYMLLVRPRMGIYLNPSNVGFKKDFDSRYIC